MSETIVRVIATIFFCLPALPLSASSIGELTKLIALQQAQIEALKKQTPGDWSETFELSLGNKGFSIGNGIARQRYRKVGDTIEVVFYVIGGSTTQWGTGTIRLALPGNFKVDTKKLLPTPYSDDRFPCGSGLIYRHTDQKRSTVALQWSSLQNAIMLGSPLSVSTEPTTIEDLKLGEANSQISGSYCVPVLA